MDARELRIGNYIQYFGNVAQVEGIVNESNGFGLQLNGGDFASINSNSLEPIPLTEEWLVKFGFFAENIHSNLILNKIEIASAIRVVSTNERGSFYLDGEIHDFMKIRIDYVHTLQNLYFALTGEELTFKTK